MSWIFNGTSTFHRQSVRWIEPDATASIGRFVRDDRKRDAKAKNTRRGLLCVDGYGEPLDLEPVNMVEAINRSVRIAVATESWSPKAQLEMVPSLELRSLGRI